jgi:hypothetical protein
VLASGVQGRRPAPRRVGRSRRRDSRDAGPLLRAHACGGPHVRAETRDHPLTHPERRSSQNGWTAGSGASIVMAWSTR